MQASNFQCQVSKGGSSLCVQPANILHCHYLSSLQKFIIRLNRQNKRHIEKLAFVNRQRAKGELLLARVKESFLVESMPFCPSLLPELSVKQHRFSVSQRKEVFGLFYWNVEIIFNYLGPKLMNLLNGQAGDREFSLRLWWKKRSRPAVSCNSLRNEPTKAIPQE